jgi:riboflavin biosynthesis pyrimidine reductase
MELDAPPASTSMVGAGAVGASSATADGVLDDIAVFEAVVAIGAVGTPSAAATLLDIGAAAA